MRLIKYSVIILMIFLWVNPSYSGTTFTTKAGILSIGGYFENASGLRLGQEGRGRLTMCRTSIQPDIFFDTGKGVRFFLAQRLVKETKYTLEDKLRKKAGLPPLESDFYDEYDSWSVRELYFDIDLLENLNIRIGRQLITWGETDVFTLLDVIDPQDSSWNLPGLFPLEETRLPLSGLRALWTMPSMGMTTNPVFEFVYFPGLDDFRVNKGAPTAGRFRPHPEDRPGAAFPFQFPQIPLSDWRSIGRNVGVRTVLPEKHGDNGRVGGRLYFFIGRWNFSIADYYTYNLSPNFYIENIERDDLGIARAAQFAVKYKRQNIVGFTFNVSDDYTKATYNGEFAYYINKPYNTYDPNIKNAVVQKDTLSSVIRIERPTYIPLLQPYDPTREFVISFQWFQDLILSKDDNLHFLIYKTPIDKVTTRLTLSIATGYKNDQWKPSVFWAYDPDRNNGLFRGILEYNPPWNERYKLQILYENFWGKDSYNFAGFFREKDSIFFKIRYQF
jgi:hypothetical protein